MDKREIITVLFAELAKRYLDTDKIISYEIHNGHDVHAFYRLKKDMDKVIHVQGYPGMSEGEQGVYVSARLRDYNKMLDIRLNDPTVSVGNEHGANIPPMFDTLATAEKSIPPNVDILESLLRRECEYLQ